VQITPSSSEYPTEFELNLSSYGYFSDFGAVARNKFSHVISWFYMGAFVALLILPKSGTMSPVELAEVQGL